jgi:hypothetical protein
MVGRRRAVTRQGASLCDSVCVKAGERKALHTAHASPQRQAQREVEKNICNAFLVHTAYTHYSTCGNSFFVGLCVGHSCHCSHNKRLF